jgi:hypothetical protein
MSSIEAKVVFTEILNPLLRGSGNDSPATALRIYGFPSCSQAPVNTHPTSEPEETNLHSCFRKNLVLLQDAGTVFRLWDLEQSDAFDGGHFQVSERVISVVYTYKKNFSRLSNVLEREIERRRDSSSPVPLTFRYRMDIVGYLYGPGGIPAVWGIRGLRVS